MKDIFVPYEIVQKLKEIGFDEPCLAYYEFSNPERLITIIKREETILNDFEKGTFTQSNVAGIGCPTWEQVKKWFRKKGFYGNVHTIEGAEKSFLFTINKSIRIYESDILDTYEQAQEQLIYKLIEIYKNGKKDR